jgi:hypothetical protein
MVHVGDVEQVDDWRNSSSIAELKRRCEEASYSAISVGEGYSHASLKQSNHPLTAELCTAVAGNTIYILTRTILPETILPESGAGTSDGGWMNRYQASGIDGGASHITLVSDDDGHGSSSDTDAATACASTPATRAAAMAAALVQVTSLPNPMTIARSFAWSTCV